MGCISASPVIVLSFKSPGKAVTSNSRAHWAKKRTMLKPWLLLTRSSWIDAGRPVNVGPSTVAICFGVPDRRRRDPSNLMPTQKAIVDELVRCGLWPDDTPEYVTEHMPTIEISGLVTITIQPR